MHKTGNTVGAAPPFFRLVVFRGRAVGEMKYMNYPTQSCGLDGVS